MSYNVPENTPPIFKGIIVNPSSGTGKVTVEAPTGLSSSLSFIFPSSNGSSGQVLSTNGSGTLSWISQPNVITAHTGLTDLAWTNAGHTATGNSVAAWDAAGNPVAVQAATDNMMLVRKGGAITWVTFTVLLTFSGLNGSIPGDLSLGGITVTSGVFA
jgi:hypothetical protein